MEVFTSTMNNFQTAINATETALNSQGSASRENARYMESLEAKLQALKSEFMRFSTSVVDSGMIKGLLDIGTGILKFINNNQLLMASLAKLGVSILVFKLASKLINLASVDISGFNRKIKATPRSFAGIKKLAISTFGKAGIAGAIAGATLVLGSLIIKMSEYAQAVRNRPETEWKETVKEIGKAEGKYREINAEIDSLQQKRIDYGLTQAEQEHLDNLISQSKELERYLDLKRKQEQAQFQKKETATGADKATLGQSQVGMVIETKADVAVGKYRNSIVGVTEATRGLSKAQEELKKANPTDADYEKLKTNVTNWENKLVDARITTSESYQAMTKKRDEYLAKYGEEKNIPDELKGGYERLSQAIKNYEQLNPSVLPSDMNEAIAKMKELGTDIGLTVDKAGNISNIDVTKFTQAMLDAGHSTGDINRYLDEMITKEGQVNNIDITSFTNSMLNAGYSTQDVLTTLQQIGSSDPEATVKLNGKDVMISDLQLVNGEIKKIPKDTDTTTHAHTKAGTSYIEAYQNAISKTPESKSTTMNANTATANQNVNDLQSNIGNTTGKTVSLWVSVKKKASKLWAYITGSAEKGTKYAKEGLYKVNDQKNPPNGNPTELIESKGEYYMADGKDAIVHLNAGDKVYTAKETQDMMRGKKNLNDNPSMLDKMRGSLAYAQSSSLDTPSLTGGANLQPKYIMSDYGGMASSVVSQSDDHSITISNMTVKSENPSDWVRQLRGLVDITN